MSNILEGRIILTVMLASDKKAIRFYTEQGEVIAKCDGDCCSATWIENVEMPALGLPAKVLSVEEVGFDEDENEEDEGEYIAKYGCDIYTDKGVITIDYRNASNGYYGGNLCWPGQRYYGGVWGQNESTEDWRAVA